jgi:dTDP-4-dehydrorhamnose 3,5-epimerase
VRFEPTAIPDLLCVEAEPLRDERGHFARIFDDALLAAQGVAFVTRQCSTSLNAKRGTLRGLHYQAAPAEELKLVRCTSGAIFDVVVDLRPQSASFRRWCGFELTADNLRSLVIPRGCAHGFLTLADASEVYYQIDTPYARELVRGVRWNDPAFAIDWPFAPLVMTARDAGYPDFAP